MPSAAAALLFCGTHPTGVGAAAARLETPVHRAGELTVRLTAAQQLPRLAFVEQIAEATTVLSATGIMCACAMHVQNGTDRASSN